MFQDMFLRCDGQFGFNKGLSISHCTFVVREVVDYYLNNGSPVYACALDMQKAFDRVNFIKLFAKLMYIGLPLHTIRILFLLYSSLNLSVFWNGLLSSSFVTLNGLKQGGILSPSLLCIFIDNLISGLERLNVGCFVSNVYYGCVA